MLKSDIVAVTILFLFFSMWFTIGYMMGDKVNQCEVSTPQPQSSEWIRPLPTPPPVPFQYYIK